MATKLIYFRPKGHRKNPNDFDVDVSFSYEILDKSIPASTQITVASNLTVFYEHWPSRVPNSGTIGCKLCVFLVGNDQCPDNMVVSNPVDRVEFHGSIGFEKPVFEIIHRLSGVKKVKFFLGQKQLPSFVEATVNDEWVNSSVTSLAITVEKIINSTGKKGAREKEPQRLKTKVLEKIVVAILNRSATSFPNLRKITMSVPNSKSIKTALTQLMDKLQYLKPTNVECNERSDMLLVNKIEPSQRSPSSPTQMSYSAATEEIDHQKVVEQKPTEVEEVDKEPAEQTDPSKSSLNDMGKLLESMLGIGTMGLGMGIKSNMTDDSPTA